MPKPTMVRLENGGVIASTRDIAEAFGKQHKNVMAAAQAILANAARPAENSAGGQNQRVTSWFREYLAEDEKGQERPAAAPVQMPGDDQVAQGHSHAACPLRPRTPMFGACSPSPNTKPR
jgi:hypothetical protein